MLERTPYHDPRYPRGDDNGGAGSTRTSVVLPVGNPQQVVVQPVDVREFYNSANDLQPSRVSPLPGLRNTQPAVLKPDPMWAHRWPDVGPYRGMTPQPFSWERASMDGFGEVTSSQRERLGRVTAELRRLATVIGNLRTFAPTDAMATQVGRLQAHADRIDEIFVSAGTQQDEMFDMALDDAESEIAQLGERVDSLSESSGAGSSGSGSGMSTTTMLIGGAAVAGLAFLIWRSNRSA